MEFKIGDRVKLVSSSYVVSHGNPIYGKYMVNGKVEYVTGMVVDILRYRSLPVKVSWENDSLNYYNHSDLEIVKEQEVIKVNEVDCKNIMSTLIQKFKVMTAKEPEKTFIKAGVMNEQFQMTQSGVELFNEFLVQKFKEEFKTEVVDKIVEEDAKK
jgi:hypothetical protein